MQRILIIYTGGTIGMKTNPETGSLAPFDFSQIAMEVPELRKLDVDVEHISFEPLIDSSNATPKFWGQIATIIQQKYDKYNGFVVLHGTDTMAYSASALSFMLENLSKPVIFTGSQIPMGDIRTDGRENLISAIEIAASGKVAEVCIYFHTLLMRANRTTKHNSEHFDAFCSNNYPPLAEAGIAIRYNEPYMHRLNPVQVDTAKEIDNQTLYINSAQDVDVEPLRINISMDTNVVVLKLFPGITPTVVKAVLQIQGLRGVVIETYGSGNAPTDAWFNDLIKEAIGRGVVVLNVTQCGTGSVDMTLYDTGLELLNAGVVGAGDITSEAAITKLMYILAQNLTLEQQMTALKNSIRGEITK